MELLRWTLSTCLIFLLGIWEACVAEEYAARTQAEQDFCPGFCKGNCQGSTLGPDYNDRICLAICETGCMDTRSNVERLKDSRWMTCGPDSYTKCANVCQQRGFGFKTRGGPLPGAPWNACMLRCITGNGALSDADYKAINEFWIQHSCYTWCDVHGAWNWKPNPKPKTDYYFWYNCQLGCAGSSGTDEIKQDVERATKMLSCDATSIDLCDADCRTKFDTFDENWILQNVCMFYCQTGEEHGKLTDTDYKKLATRFKPTTCDRFCDSWCPTFHIDPAPTAEYTCTDICKAGCPGSAGGGGGEPADVARAEKLLHDCNAACFDSCHPYCYHAYPPANASIDEDWNPFNVCMYYCETGDEAGKLSDKDKAMVEQRLKPTCSSFCDSQKSHVHDPKPKNEYNFWEVCNHGCAGSSGKDDIHQDAKRAEKMLSCDAGCFDSCHDDCKSKFTQFDKDPIVKDVCLFYCQTGDTPGKLTDTDNKKLDTRFKPTTCDAFCNGWCSTFNLDPPPERNGYYCSSPCKVGCPGSACVADGGSGPSGEPADVARAERLLHACDASCYDGCYDKCHEKFKAAVDKDDMYPFDSCLYHCQTGTKPGILTLGDYNLIKTKFNA